LDRFDYSLRQQVIAPKKIYCADTGLARAVGFRFSDGIGKAMENIVAVELQRMKALEPNTEVYYWKDHAQREVDFIVKKGLNIRQLIQVTYASDRIEVPTREIASLETASRALRCKYLLVITWDFEGEEKLGTKKVRFIPLWKWLLKKQTTAPG